MKEFFSVFLLGKEGRMWQSVGLTVLVIVATLEELHDFVKSTAVIDI